MNTLVIGSSGTISKAYKKLSKKKKNLIFTSSKKNKFSKSIIFFDILKTDITPIIKKNNISKVIIFSAISNPEECKKKIKMSYSVNVAYTKKLIKKLILLKVYFIFFSSEYVFDGVKGSYTERSKLSSKMIYGKHKISIENYIRLKKYRKHLILRISKTFGTDISDGTLFSSYLRSYLKGQRSFEIANDQIFSPLYVNDLIRLINISLKRQLTGFYQVCGDVNNSRFEFIKNFFKKQKIKNVNLSEIPMEKFDKGIFYPLNTSMKNKKIKKITNFKFSKISNLKFKKNYKNDIL